MRHEDVVVGVDGSTPARSALRWAAAEAARRGVALRVLAAYHVPLRSARYGGFEDLRAMARDHCAELIISAVAEAQALEPGIEVTGSVALGNAAAELVEAGRTAGLLVVGSRGHGGFASLLLGSVGQRVATYATVPVVVVRGRADTASGPVVVGVDDAESGERVLDVAFDEAKRREVNLIAVHAFAVPVPPLGVDAPVGADVAAAHEDASDLLREAVAPWREKFPTVTVETLAGRGSAGRVLTSVSGTAGLLVVGSRGHGSLTGTLLGSVGLQLLHHAECPVLIVRPTN